MSSRAMLRPRALLAAACALTVAPLPALAEEEFPGKTWRTRTPDQAALDPAGLQAFSRHVGGRGCLVRAGFLVHSWGEAAQRADVASAAKPFYSHLLFKAVQDGKLPGLDAKLLPYEPRLADLNAALGHKDRQITFRHVANQVSCYGLAERPGEAYAYNDWQMALFWDTLFLKVYATTYATVDEKVFAPLLTGPIGCEDSPTLMAFGLKNRPGRVAISPRDFCRFGLLYLRGGNWAGRQLLDAKYVKLAVSQPVPNSIPRAGKRAAEMIPGQRSIGSQVIPDNQTDHMGSYTWLWWINGVDREGKRHWPDAPTDTFGAFGHGGIRAMAVLPSLDIIVSWNDSRTAGRDKENEAFRLLVAAVRKRPVQPAPTTSTSSAAETVAEPAESWPEASPAAVAMDAAMLAKARDYALRGGGSGRIIRHGKCVFQWGDQKRLYDLKSSSKSFGVTALGLAIGDGKLALSDKASARHPSFGTPPPENAATGWLGDITLLHLATQTAGFDKPGGYTKLLFAPGTKWSYSDGGPNWLAECVTLAYRRDVSELMFERVFKPLGIKPADLTWRKNSYRPASIDGIARREFGSGVSANVDAMARFGLLYLHKGRWGGRQIIPAEFVAACATTPKAVKGLPVLRPELYGRASDHYGLLWWNNNDGALAKVPPDAYWTWGLYDSLTVVIPSLDVVVARAGKSFPGDWSGHYDKLAPFLDPIVASIAPPKDKPKTDAPTSTSSSASASASPPYPPSGVIAEIVWAPKETIVRQAPGSDNWPTTWADDGHLYTAYGDGWGFEPKLPTKLSLGLARVEGPAEGFKGVNIRSPTGEQKGDGAAGKKASGMLCVGGRLYMLVRNAKLSQLAWSADHARTWTWADWRFDEALACPTFLNFGRDYAGAIDEYVYVYSFDADSAYKPSDRMVLARAEAGKLTDRSAWEFLQRLDEAGKPLWTADARKRGAVFQHKGRCYRSGISYNAGLKRYLWVQVMGGSDTRRAGGLAIYDAPQPWGPWTTAYFAEPWDAGPGESACLPTKWMSGDGRTVHLVFSGDDTFSVRKATLRLKGD